MFSFLVPAVCYKYMEINDSTRLVTYNAVTNLCDRSLFSSNVTWVRFVAGGGTQIPTFCSGRYLCGTWAPGWMDGSIPAAGVIADVHVCWTVSSNCSYRDPMKIVNCQGYYVYGLNAPGACSYRYCTIWKTWWIDFFAFLFQFFLNYFVFIISLCLLLVNILYERFGKKKTRRKIESITRRVFLLWQKFNAAHLPKGVKASTQHPGTSAPSQHLGTFSTQLAPSTLNSTMSAFSSFD